MHVFHFLNWACLGEMSESSLTLKVADTARSLVQCAGREGHISHFLALLEPATW